MRNCPNCNAPVGAPLWKAKSTFLWANKHGQKIRIFCHICGQWSDVTTFVDMTPVRVEIRKQPWPDEIPF